MSLALLRAELNGFTAQNLMPGRWSIESIISWCRGVAKHDADALEPNEDNDLFEVVNSFIEKLLLAQDVERHDFYRKNHGSLFDLLAREFDGIVRDELVARITGYGIDRVALKDLFRDHFPANLGLERFEHQAHQSEPTATLTEPAQ